MCVVSALQLLAGVHKSFGSPTDHLVADVLQGLAGQAEVDGLPVPEVRARVREIRQALAAAEKDLAE